MLVAVLSGFILAVAAPVLHRLLRKTSGWFFALLPAGIFVYFAQYLPAVAMGKSVTVSYPWIPLLGIRLSFLLDGLSLLFVLLISGIGALILIYAAAYLKGHHHLGRFFTYILSFMAAMLGTVLADNVITLFVFWELTSLASYFLIGFDHEREEARAGALQALLVTGIGGLALLAGFLTLGSIGGSLEISTLLTQGDVVRGHGWYTAALILILAGAFTKSAQFPFHFWLPSAMEAPTPVSAYLHSATMVKAGVYLIARLSPVLGGTHLWHDTIIIAGGITMAVGAFMALTQKDLKRILAYSTVSSLGTLTLLLGIGTPAAASAAMVYLLAHALYKGSLFLVAGAVDHGTGTRNVGLLGGLRRAMPVTAAAGGIAALSMAGLPPTLGFIGKELLYETQLHAPQWALFIVVTAVFANVLLVAVAGSTGIHPFFGTMGKTPKKPHEGPFSLWLGPLLLAVLGLFLGLVPGTVLGPFFSSAASAILGVTTTTDLSLWHGFNAALLLSVITLSLGAAVYAGRWTFLQWADKMRKVAAVGPARWYDVTHNGMLWTAVIQTRLLQSGYLRYYLMIVLGIAFLFVAYPLGMKAGVRLPTAWPGVRFYEWVTAGLILAAALTAVMTRSRLTAVAALGVVGYGVALIYIFFSSPDLAMTQFSVETLTVVLFVLVLYRLPRFATITPRLPRIRDMLVSLANGGLMAALVLTATSEKFRSRVSHFFTENTLALAKGKNTVNVILVDFRGLDTLGEITVLAVAALGVFVLLKTRPKKEVAE